MQTKQAIRVDPKKQILFDDNGSQEALINSIASDLRSPLVSIQGALSLLKADLASLDNATRRSLIENAAEEAERLNHLISNLLDMARVEAHAIRIVSEPYDIEYVMSSALKRQEYLLKGRPLNISIQNDLPLISMDGVLIVRVLADLFENAVHGSPSGTPIDINVDIADANLRISIADRGIGLSHEDLTRVFDKFYRVPRSGSAQGMGLGLAISKGIIEAHGGNIVAKNHDGGGSVFILTLPLHRAIGDSDRI